MIETEQRLRSALEGTHENEPRPLAKLDLPLGAERLLPKDFLDNLRRAAVLAPVICRKSGHSVILTRRAEHLTSHKGQISFPGGGRDAEDFDAAANALREADEEIGLPPDRVEVIGYLDDYPTISNYRVTPVIGIIEGPFDPRPDPSEVAEVFEVPLSLVLDPKAYKRKSLSRDGLIIPYHELNWKNYRVWGATAGMLWDLCCRVNQIER